MWSVIFAISAINFALGIVLALLLHENRVYLVPRPETIFRQEEELYENHYEDEEYSESAALASKDDIPQEWFDLLKGEGVEPNSFVEASLEVLRLEVGQYRTQLMDIEEQVRAQKLTREIPVLQDLMQQLNDVNAAWVEKQKSAAKQLAANNLNQGAYTETGQSSGTSVDGTTGSD